MNCTFCNHRLGVAAYAPDKFVCRSSTCFNTKNSLPCYVMVKDGNCFKQSLPFLHEGKHYKIITDKETKLFLYNEGFKFTLVMSIPPQILPADETFNQKANELFHRLFNLRAFS